MDAAEAATVRLFVLSDFGYGPNHQHLPEFEAIGKPRQDVLTYAKDKAGANPQFTWSAIAIGNPIDWVRFLRRRLFNTGGILKTYIRNEADRLPTIGTPKVPDFGF